MNVYNLYSLKRDKAYGFFQKIKELIVNNIPLNPPIPTKEFLGIEN